MRDYSNKVRQRFIKDFNLPIQLYSGNYFKYFCTLYDPLYGISAKLRLLDAAIDSAGSEEEFLNVYYTLRDTILTEIKALPAYADYNNLDMNQYSVGPLPYASGDIYKQTNVGSTFLSIDMVKANYQVMRKFSSSLVFGSSSYSEFLARFASSKELSTIIEYMKESKYLRQVIFGNMNPKRQVTMQKYYMKWALDVICQRVSKDGPNGELISVIPGDVAFFSNDEIVLKLDRMLDRDGRIQEVWLRHLRSAINRAYESTEIIFSSEFFKLSSVFNKYYVKRDLISDSVTFKAVPSKFFAQVYKHYFGMKLNAMDLSFKDEGHVARYLTPLSSLDAINKEEEADE